MSKQYNKEEELNKAANLLKELPHISAPPDFEMNLRRKLNSLNYEQEKAAARKLFPLRKAMIPITAFGTCIIALFIVFHQKQNPEAENPFMTAPKLRVEVKNTLPEVSNKNLLINPRNVTSNDVVIESSTSSQIPAAIKRSQTMAADVNKKADTPVGNIASSDRNAKSKRFNFDGYENDVDQSLRARPGDYSSDSYYGNGHNVNFGGFNIIQGDGSDVEQLRARMDSIKRWMKENSR